MPQNDHRCEHLGWIETALQTAHPDLPHLQISGQSHYRSPDRIAFIVVYGVEDDHTRRRQIRSEAGEMLRGLDYTVALEPGRDVYDLAPERPDSAHDRLRILRSLRAAGGAQDVDR